MDVYVLDAHIESRLVRLITLLGVHPSSEMLWSSSGGLDHPIIHAWHRLLVELPVEEIAVELAHPFRVAHWDFKVYYRFAQSEISSSDAVWKELY